MSSQVPYYLEVIKALPRQSHKQILATQYKMLV